MAYCKGINDAHAHLEREEKEYYCYEEVGVHPGARCKFVPCFEVGYCKDAPPGFERKNNAEDDNSGDEELWQWDESDVDLNQFLSADNRANRTPRPTKAPKPPRTSRPTPLKTPRPTKEPRTPRPTPLKTPRPTNEPRTPRPTNWGVLTGCESITRQDMCEGLIRPECVWKEGYPKHLEVEMSVKSMKEFFVENGYLKSVNVDSINSVMLIGVLLAVLVLYACSKYLKKNGKDVNDSDGYSRLDGNGYGSIEDSI